MVPGRQPVGLSEDLLFWAVVASGWLVPSSGPESRGAGQSSCFGAESRGPRVLSSHSSAWLSPKNPAADPVPRPGLQPPWSLHRSWDLIVLKHSSYHQIFQCPLSLVSDLHICWNTVGCSLCSSDQLGISLVLRGSALCSHISPPTSTPSLQPPLFSLTFT